MPRQKKRKSDPNYPGRVTMQDIANVAGVHIMTVSNALGNIRGVAPATKEKVLRIAAELNYIPNSAARALVRGRTGMIAVVCGALNEPYYANIVHLLEENTGNDGYKLTLLKRPHDVVDLVNDTGSVAIDGAIGVDLYHWDDQFRAHPAVPCVAIGTYEHPYLDYVMVDLSEGIKQALHMMAKQDRKNIVYVVDSPHLALPSEVRARTYLNVMEQLNLPPQIINIYTDEVKSRTISVKRQLLKDYFESQNCPDAILCLNDELAMCSYRALRDLGRRVPEDVLIVGCDGQPHMEFFDPSLSTVAQPMEEMCATAWQFLKHRIANPDSPHQRKILEGTLIVRQSLVVGPLQAHGLRARH